MGPDLIQSSPVTYTTNKPFNILLILVAAISKFRWTSCSDNWFLSFCLGRFMKIPIIEQCSLTANPQSLVSSCSSVTLFKLPVFSVICESDIEPRYMSLKTIPIPSQFIEKKPGQEIPVRSKDADKTTSLIRKIVLNSKHPAHIFS